jgi:hypothetical protein
VLLAAGLDDRSLFVALDSRTAEKADDVVEERSWCFTLYDVILLYLLK